MLFSKLYKNAQEDPSSSDIVRESELAADAGSLPWFKPSEEAVEAAVEKVNKNYKAIFREDDNVLRRDVNRTDALRHGFKYLGTIKDFPYARKRRFYHPGYSNEQNEENWKKLTALRTEARWDDIRDYTGRRDYAKAREPSGVMPRALLGDVGEHLSGRSRELVAPDDRAVWMYDLPGIADFEAVVSNDDAGSVIFAGPRTKNHEVDHALAEPTVYRKAERYSPEYYRPYAELLRYAGHPRDIMNNIKDMSILNYPTSAELEKRRAKGGFEFLKTVGITPFETALNSSAYSRGDPLEHIRTYAGQKFDIHREFGAVINDPWSFEMELIKHGLADYDKNGYVFLTDKGRAWNPPVNDSYGAGVGPGNRNDIDRQLRENNAVRRWRRMSEEERNKIPKETRERIDKYVKRFERAYQRADNLKNRNDGMGLPIEKTASFYKLCSILNPEFKHADAVVQTAEKAKMATTPDIVPNITNNADVTNTVSNSTPGSAVENTKETKVL